MELKTKRNIIKWVVYSFTLIILCVLQTTPGFLEFFGVKPYFLLPFCVMMSAYEDEKTAAIIGGAGGLLLGFASNRFLGFYAAMLLVFCIIAALLTMYLVKSSFLWGMIFSASAATVLLFVDYFFYSLIWRGTQSVIMLKRFYLPELAVTIVVSVPIFFLCRFYNRKIVDVKT